MSKTEPKSSVTSSMGRAAGAVWGYLFGFAFFLIIFQALILPVLIGFLKPEWTPRWENHLIDLIVQENDSFARRDAGLFPEAQEGRDRPPTAYSLAAWITEGIYKNEGAVDSVTMLQSIRDQRSEVERQGEHQSVGVKITQKARDGGRIAFGSALRSLRLMTTLALVRYTNLATFMVLGLMMAMAAYFAGEARARQNMIDGSMPSAFWANLWRNNMRAMPVFFILAGVVAFPVYTWILAPILMGIFAFSMYWFRYFFIELT